MAKPKTSMTGFPDRSWKVAPAPVQSLDLTGRTLAVVGGTDGLGRAIAAQAVARGARVTVVGRTFRDQASPALSFVKADLSSMRAAQTLGRELPAETFDVVVFTNGIMAAKTREATAEGLERDIAVSTLSRLAVIRELAPRLGTRRSSPAFAPRLFVMGFPGSGQLGDPADLNAERAYDAMAVHMNTVAGNEALVLDGARRYPAVQFFGLNPGLVKTNIRANFLGEGSFTHRVAELVIGLVTPSPQTYAKRIVPVLFAPELDGHSGAMFGAKGTPILPTEGMTPAQVTALVSGGEALVSRALAGSGPAASVA